jgi:hypothetical protein
LAAAEARYKFPRLPERFGAPLIVVGFVTGSSARVNGQEPRAATDCAGTDQVAPMAELVALRAILLNVLFKLAKGQTLTAQEMRGLIDRADSDKLKKARERLAQAAEPEMQPKGKS